jgi:hypothetical protein
MNEAETRIEPDALSKKPQVPTNASVFFTITQPMSASLCQRRAQCTSPKARNMFVIRPG